MYIYYVIFSSSKNALNRRMDMYMKEHDHLVSSERMVDEQIRIAIDTKENLVTQRAAFKKIQYANSNYTISIITCKKF